MTPPPPVLTYYFWTISDWAYLGHERLLAMAGRYGAEIDFRPVDLPVVYAHTGGILLSKRSSQRQEARIGELRRWKARLGSPINIEPKHFPVDHHPSSRLVVAAKRAGLPLGALTLAIMRAVWAEERDISDRDTLREVAGPHVPDIGALMAAAERPEAQAEYERFTREAPGDGVFGSPFYLFDGQSWWGQDRLDFVEETLARWHAECSASETANTANPQKANPRKE